MISAGTASPELTEHFPLAVGSIVSRTACLDAELHLRLLVRPGGKVVVLAQEDVIVCLCLKDTEIHAASKQGNTTNSALESLHSLHRVSQIGQDFKSPTEHSSLIALSPNFCAPTQ